jgi:hypothetical protein
MNVKEMCKISTAPRLAGILFSTAQRHLLSVALEAETKTDLGTLLWKTGECPWMKAGPVSSRARRDKENMGSNAPSDDSMKLPPSDESERTASQAAGENMAQIRYRRGFSFRNRVHVPPMKDDSRLRASCSRARVQHRQRKSTKPKRHSSARHAAHTRLAV